MRTITVYLVLLLCLFASKISAQETFEGRAKAIAKNIELATKEEKALLKTKVEALNVQLEKGQITKQVADKQKMDLATATAIAIEKRVGEEQIKLNALVQDKVNGVVLMKNYDRFSIKTNWNEKDSINQHQGERRTTSQFVFSGGFNNVLNNGSSSKSDFKVWKSDFLEWGFTRNYRLMKDRNLLHLKYGFSVMYNSLHPTNNRVFAVANDQTNLTTSAIELSNSRLKNVYLVAPLHLEFDFSKNKEHNGKPYFDSHQGIRIGFGGYVGTNLKSKQYIETDINDYETTSVTKGDFNTSNFIYGTSAYIGYKEASLYVKYDLNPLFTNNIIKQNNISVGLRFDFN